jgi:hypothetical protein
MMQICVTNDCNSPLRTDRMFDSELSPEETRSPSIFLLNQSSANPDCPLVDSEAYLPILHL